MIKLYLKYEGQILLTCTLLMGAILLIFLDLIFDGNFIK